MFNEQLKRRFLDTVNNAGTKKNGDYILARAELTESALNKDIYEFDMSELDSLIRSYTNKSPDMVNVTVSYLREYIKFCIQEGYIPSRINYLEGLGRQELFKYVDQEAANNKYITYDELKEMENQCLNPQDAIIIRLLFMGVRGDELCELINLKTKDIKEDKIIIQKSREIPIDSNTYELAIEADAQVEYIRGNGEVGIGCKNTVNFINSSPYILKPTGMKKGGQLIYNTLRSKITRIKEYFGNDYINPRNIWMSGIFWRLQQIGKTPEELTKEDYVSIHKMYDYNDEYFFKTREEYLRFSAN